MLGKLYILSGPRQVGKTTTCGRLAEFCRARAIDLAGLICPAKEENGRKYGIELVELRTGNRRDLAVVDDMSSPLRTDEYRFDVEVVAWGSQVIDSATPCTVLMIDELGPLELIRNQGWVNGLEVLRGGRYELGVVVIRPELVTAFQQAMHPDRPCVLVEKTGRDDYGPENLILTELEGVWTRSRSTARSA